MIREFLQNFMLLFSSKLKGKRNRNLRALKMEEEKLNAKLDALEEMEEQLKDAKK